MTVGAAPAAPAIDVQWSDHPAPARASSTDGRVIYAVGDIHGCYAQMTALLEAIVADIARTAQNKPALLVLCGDYVDRGPDSAKVVAALVWLARQSDLAVACLRGNHEEMLCDFLDTPGRLAPWLERDGLPTLASYGVTATPDDSCEWLRDRLLDAMPAAHLAFLRDLPVRLICGDYVFVHAGLKPGVPLSRQQDGDCLWIGREFLASDHRFEKIVVHGHSWTSDRPVIADHRIGIDTGAYQTGVLTAVRLEDDRVAVVQARAAPPSAVH